MKFPLEVVSVMCRNAQQFYYFMSRSFCFGYFCSISHSH